MCCTLKWENGTKLIANTFHTDNVTHSQTKTKLTVHDQHLSSFFPPKLHAELLEGVQHHLRETYDTELEKGQVASTTLRWHSEISFNVPENYFQGPMIKLFLTLHLLSFSIQCNTNWLLATLRTESTLEGWRGGALLEGLRAGKAVHFRILSICSKTFGMPIITRSHKTQWLRELQKSINHATQRKQFPLQTRISSEYIVRN